MPAAVCSTMASCWRVWQWTNPAKLSAPGLFEADDDEADRVIYEFTEAVADLPKAVRKDSAALQEAAKTALRRALGRRLQKRPLVDVHLLRV